MNPETEQLKLEWNKKRASIVTTQWERSRTQQCTSERDNFEGVIESTAAQQARGTTLREQLRA
ncbi:hypothetical protein Syun_001165 [Stephania yunnanensis]|uniref:Uncharacterized protein n=1 Tax=Stephania yunnanensis TaxID=152371 RepID=A0AAP0LE86_9MAGN